MTDALHTREGAQLQPSQDPGLALPVTKKSTGWRTPALRVRPAFFATSINPNVRVSAATNQL